MARMVWCLWRYIYWGFVKRERLGVLLFNVGLLRHFFMVDSRDGMHIHLHRGRHTQVQKWEGDLSNQLK
jgi:hypothetical protein